MNLPKIPQLPPPTPRAKKLGVTGITLAAILPVIQPIAEKAIISALTAKELNDQQTLRLENAEKRLTNLEARGTFLHGPPSVQETHSELVKK